MEQNHNDSSENPPSINDVLKKLEQKEEQADPQQAKSDHIEALKGVLSKADSQANVSEASEEQSFQEKKIPMPSSSIKIDEGKEKKIIFSNNVEKLDKLISQFKK